MLGLKLWVKKLGMLDRRFMLIKVMITFNWIIKRS